jgi:hypothetical protein
MKYQFKGNLRGFYCGDCFDFLYKANVKIYAVDRAANVTAMAVAREKETFHQRSDEELKAISKRLIGEAVTDEAGNFSVDLADKNYDGGAFDIDFECGTVPIRFGPKNPPKPRGPFQFHITTLQPMWKEGTETGQQAVAYWEYAINSKFWCWLLRLFKLYVVCGLVEVCEKKVPLANVKVKAFDVDLMQDDYLGEAVTDASGHFKIYYTEADFSKTIFSWLNIEWPAGPDLYFSVEQLNGTILLKEPRSKGHTPGRENASNCTCVKLCVPGDVDTPQPVPVPAFLRIGGIDYETQMQSHVGETGLTNSNYAFFSSLRLNGILAQTYGGVAMEYCFEYTNQYNGLGQPINWSRVLADKMGQCDIGYVEKATLMPADITHPFPWYHYDYQYCIVNSGSAPGIIGVPVDAQGWILVPQQNDNPLNAAGTGMFVANGNQISVNSAKLETFPSIDLTGLVAGNSSTSTGKPLGNDKVVALRMLVRQQGNDLTIAEAGRCTRTAINNTFYDGMNHHPEWGPKPITSEYGVCMVDILQLQMAGCAKITSQVDVLYTCAHPNLGSVSASLTGPGGTVALPVPAPVNPKDNFGTITHLFAPADPLCAYLVTLSTTYLLTTGDGNMSSVQDQIAFCR